MMPRPIGKKKTVVCGDLHQAYGWGGHGQDETKVYAELR